MNRRKENIYRTIIKNATEGILVANIETKDLLNANSAFCKMIGYDEEEIRQMNIADLHPQETIKHVFSEFEAQSRKEKILSENIQCLRKDGTIFYADIKTTNIVIDGIKCNVGFFTDITERLEFEKEKNEPIIELKSALNKIRVLSGTLPICANCKDIRDDKGNWQQIEAYIRDRSEAKFSHGICPDCAKKLYPEIYDKIKDSL